MKGTADWTGAGGDGTANIRNADTGKCIGLAGDVASNGMRVVQLPCNQWWTVTRTTWKGFLVHDGNPDYYLMTNIFANHCLDVPHGSKENGVPIQIWNTMIRGFGAIPTPALIPASTRVFRARSRCRGGAVPGSVVRQPLG